MANAHIAISALLALLTAFSGLMKIRRDPKVVKVIHDTVGVPMTYFPVLAACEFAGAAGLVIGIWYPSLGVAAAVGLVLYFVGAVASHLLVGDVKGIGPAMMMLVLSGAALTLGMMTM